MKRLLILFLFPILCFGQKTISVHTFSSQWKKDYGKDLTGTNTCTTTDSTKFTQVAGMPNKGINQSSASGTTSLWKTGTDISAQTRTYTAWFKVLSHPGSGQAGVMVASYTATTKNMFGIFYNWSNYSPYTGGSNGLALRVVFNRHGVTTYVYEKTGQITDGKWHHVCLVYSSAAASLSMYYDGKLLGTRTSASGNGSITITSSYGIAGYHDGTLPNAYCTVGEVRSYDYALTATQIRQLYNYNLGYLQ